MMLQFRGDCAYPKRTFKQGIGLHESQGIQLFFAVTWHSFHRQFQSVLLLYQHDGSELFCTRIWVFSCPLVSHAVSSLVLLYFSPYQRDVSGICLHKNLSVHFFFGVSWHMLFPQCSGLILFPVLSALCFGKLFFFSFLIYQHKVLYVHMAGYSC